MVSVLLDPESAAATSDVPPAGHYQVAPPHLADTDIIETDYTTTGMARVPAPLNVGSVGRLSGTERAQRIEILVRGVDLSWEFGPGDGFGAIRGRAKSGAIRWSSSTRRRRPG